MINYTAGPANVTAAVRTAVDPHRRLLPRLRREGRARRHRRGGRKGRREDRLAGGCARQHHRSWRSWSAALLWRLPLATAERRQAGGDPVHLRLGRHAEGGGAVPPQPRSPTPCRPRRGSRSRPTDKLLNVLPVFHSFGLTGGTILPLVIGVRLFLYPSPLHYKIIPRDRAQGAADHHVRHRHLPRRLCPHRQGQRFLQPAPRRRRRRGGEAPRRGASGASASAPRSSRVSA